MVRVEAYRHARVADDTVLVLSEDKDQRFIFTADGANGQVSTLLRDTGERIAVWGRHGRQPGQFKWVHNIAIDSKGNLYTTETYQGRRLQKFVYKGIQMVPREQGVVWPVKK